MKSNSSNGKKTFEKISILINLILIPIILIAASFAWFSNNQTVSAGGIPIKVEGSTYIEASLVSYGVLTIDGSYYTVDTDNEMYELPLHDPNGILFSKYELALLIKVELKSDSPVKADLYAESSVNNIPIEKDTIKENYISNCITLTPATFDENTKVATKSDTETQSFISADTNGTYTKSKSKLQLFSGEVSTEPQALYFLIEYNEPFFDYFDPIVMQYWIEDPNVKFSNDLKFNVYGN